MQNERFKKTVAIIISVVLVFALVASLILPVIGLFF